MVSGLLLIQFSPATSGAALPLVIVAPARGQIAQIDKASKRPNEKATDRLILDFPALAVIIHNCLDASTGVKVVPVNHWSLKRLGRGKVPRQDAELKRVDHGRSKIEDGRSRVAMAIFSPPSSFLDLSAGGLVDELRGRWDIFKLFFKVDSLSGFSDYFHQR